MAKVTNITAAQITAVKKRLRSLPMNSTGTNRENALELLTSDFQKAIKKGYTLKDIQGFLAEEGINIPAYLLKGK
jgi:exopolysaccharide biosynthesis protein